MTRKELVHLNTKNKTTKKNISIKNNNNNNNNRMYTMRVKKVAAPNMASLPPKKTKTKRNSQMKAIQSYTHVENIFLCFAFVCLVALPKIWLASSYVFSGHYLTGTMFIVIVTKPKIKKTKITKI